MKFLPFFLFIVLFPKEVLSQKDTTILRFENINVLTVILKKHPELDINKDGNIQQYEADLIIELNLSSSNLDNAQDILKFKNLKKIVLHSNKLTFLEIRNHQNLEELYIVDNQLKKIVLENLPHLKSISLGNNRLKEFTPKNVPNLEAIYLFGNKISEIDLTQYSKLTNLNIGQNCLKELDISQNIMLVQFNIEENKIKSLDISKNINLNLKINYFDSTVKITGTEEQMKYFKPGPKLIEG